MFRHSSDRLLFALFLMPAVLAGCARSDQAVSREGVDAPLAVAARTSMPAYHSVAGTVRSQTTSSLSANVVGTVVRVLASEGDRVRAGQLLVEIDSREPRAQADRARAGSNEIEHAIEAARATAQLAEETDRRYQALGQRGSASVQERDEVHAKHLAAAADLQRLLAQRDGARAASAQASAVLDYSSVRAPIAGVITARWVDPGAQAAPGRPLMAIEDERTTRVDTSVPEDVPVRVGDRARVEAGEQQLTARVTQVQPSVDAAGRSAVVKLELERPLRSGSYVRVSFPTGSRSAVTMPAAAVVRRGQLTSVFVVGADHIARMRLITVGAIDGAQAEVLSGLDPGETIVSLPTGVHDGMIVRKTA
jgi:RND family efflux transporter, MFP subunit